MKLLFKILVMAVVFMPVIPQQLKASEAIELTEQVQNGLIAAKPVRGQGVDRQLFNGKPVLVVFFASW
jgi:hypothetical protein